MARYAHQPISELRQLSLRELDLFFELVNDIVRAENGKGREKQTSSDKVVLG